MNMIEKIHEVVCELGCEVRIKDIHNAEPAAWSEWISNPSPNYIETFSSGPWPSYEVEWIDVNPVATIYIGRLVKDKQVDHREAIEAGLMAADIPYEWVDDLIRIPATRAVSSSAG